MDKVTVSVDEIKKGDVYGNEGAGWTAMEDARTMRGVVSVLVMYADGGTGTRTWADNSRELVVSRG